MENRPTLRDTTLTIGEPTENETTNNLPILDVFKRFEERHFIMPTNHYITLLATQEAYKNPTQRKQFLSNNINYDIQNSNDRIAVYTTTNSRFNELFIGIRGTKLTNIRDLYDDIGVLTSKVNTSVFTTQYVMKCIDIINKYNSIDRDNIYIGAHSLGFITSSITSYIMNTNGIGFNGATTLFNNLNSNINILGRNYNISNLKNYDYITSYALQGDIIAIPSNYTFKNAIVINLKRLQSLNALQLHSIDTMVEVCLPRFPLDNTARPRRRFNRIEDAEIEATGADALEAQRQNNGFDELRNIRQPTNINPLLKKFVNYFHFFS